MKHKRPSPYFYREGIAVDLRHVTTAYSCSVASKAHLIIRFDNQSDLDLTWLDGENSASVFVRVLHDAREAYWRSRS